VPPVRALEGDHPIPVQKATELGCLGERAGALAVEVEYSVLNGQELPGGGPDKVSGRREGSSALEIESLENGSGLTDGHDNHMTPGGMGVTGPM
jgi:hypothetical protein